MPSELNPDAPAEIWAGNADAAAMAELVGAEWLQPLYAIGAKRVVNLIDLCGAPPPSQVLLTKADLIAGVVPGGDKDAVRAKLEQNVNRVLWDTYCHHTDATPQPTFEPNPAPPDLPAGEPEDVPIDYLPDIYAYTKWLTRETLPRSYHAGSFTTVTGVGELQFTAEVGIEYPVKPAGLEVSLTSAPDYQPHSDGPEDGIWWDLGWLSWGSVNRWSPPVRIQRPEWIVYGLVMPVMTCRYNLRPDVVVRIRPLYPDQPQMPSG